jgi:hypothetical protein
MLSWDRFLRSFGAFLVVLGALYAVPTSGAAQDEEEEEASSDEEGETAAAPAQRRTGSGAPIESWIAMAVALGVGAATIAVGGIIGRLALDQNAIALDPRSTQLVANATHHTASDYALASTVTLTIGGIIAGIGAVWAIILPFSTPPGVAVQARISPTSIGLEGTF